MIYLPLELRRKISALVSSSAPRSLRCTICGMPEQYATMHLIHHARIGEKLEGHPPGVVAICDDCHDECSREERLMGYLDRVRAWEKDGMHPDEAMERWMAIIDAVMLEDTEWQEYPSG